MMKNIEKAIVNSLGKISDEIERQTGAIQNQTEIMKTLIERVNNIEDNLWHTCISVQPNDTWLNFNLAGANVRVSADYRDNTFIQEKDAILVRCISKDSVYNKYTKEQNLTPGEIADYKNNGFIIKYI